jgi:hypothetical protein
MLPPLPDYVILFVKTWPDKFGSTGKRRIKKTPSLPWNSNPLSPALTVNMQAQASFDAVVAKHDLFVDIYEDTAKTRIKL